MKRYLLLILPILCGLILFPQAASSGAAEALRLCGVSLIPALFPFMILCKLTISLGLIPQGGRQSDRLLRRLFGVGGEVLTPLLLSFIGGYPVGVAAICEQYKAGCLSKGSAERALRFCNNSGPAFFLGIIGSQLFQDSHAGLLLYLIHVFAALLTGYLTAAPAVPVTPAKHPEKARISFGTAFLDAVSDSCSAILKICSLVITFRVLLRLIEATALFQLLPDGASTLLAGTLELTCGILALQPSRASFLLAALFMGWGGLCVHMQAASLYRPLGLIPKKYYLSKLLHGILSLLLAWICLSPSPLRLIVGTSSLLICCILSQIHKKWAGNPQQIAI